MVEIKIWHHASVHSSAAKAMYNMELSIRSSISIELSRNMCRVKEKVQLTETRRVLQRQSESA